MADKLKVGLLFGSDTAHLPEQREDFNDLQLQLHGHNDSGRLIDARVCEIVPLLLTPDYLARDWRYDFSRFDVIVNLIADPDINASSLLMAITALTGVTTPVVNDPRQIVRTRRDILSGLLRPLPGLLVPQTVRLAPGQTASVVASEHGMNYPLLLRSAGSHTGAGLIRVETAEELDAALAAGAIAPPAYLTEFIDCRGPDGLWRKMRLMVVGETVLMRHYLFFDHWLINAASQPFMYGKPDLLETERKAAAEPLKVLPPNGAELLALIKRRVGLDYFGMDCAPTSDGRLALFEVNAVMNMLPATSNPARRNFTIAAINRVATDLNGLLRERAASKPKKKPDMSGRAKPPAGRAKR